MITVDNLACVALYFGAAMLRVDFALGYLAPPRALAVQL
jgi:hypothetical protein